MVTILPKENDWSDFGRDIGSGLVQGYTKRSDENALQKAIADLGENPSAMEMWNAISKTKTYSNEPKQNLLKEFLGVSQVEEFKRKAQENERIHEEKFAEQKRSTSKKEEQRERALDIQENKSKAVEKKAHTEQQLGAGLQTIKEMRDIGKKGNLGIGTGLRSVYSAEAAKDAAQYEQLGKSLIALASPIVIRNRKEFEVLSEKLFNPSLRDAEREGILNAMENIILREVNESGQGVPTQNETKIRVKNKLTGKTGTVTPFEGMDEKYERI